MSYYRPSTYGGYYNIVSTLATSTTENVRWTVSGGAGSTTCKPPDNQTYYHKLREW